MSCNGLQSGRRGWALLFQIVVTSGYDDSSYGSSSILSWWMNDDHEGENNGYV